LTYSAKPVLSSLIITFIILSFIILNTSKYVSKTYSEKANEIQGQERLLNYHIVYEGNLQELFEEGKIIGMKELYNQLTNISGTDYFEISENVIGNFGIKMDGGRAFNTEDYKYNENEKIPIILGSEYKGLYEIGDTLHGEYLFKPQGFTVIGITKENSYVNNEWGLKSLSRYILMPMFNCSYDPLNYEDNCFQIRHYLNKTSGFFSVPSSISFNELNGNIETLAQDSKLAVYSVSYTEPIEAVQVGFMTVKGKAHSSFMMAATFFILLIFIIITTLLLLKRAKINIQDYTVCLISGMDYRLILRSLILDSAFIISVGNVFTILSSLVLFKNFFYSTYAIALSIVFLFIAITVFIIGLNKKRILKLMMEENKNDM
jgi:hypothetical protein